MIIYRDGQAIELTREECRQVYDELEKEYKTEDIRGKLEEMEVEFDDGDLDVLVDRINYALGKNDSYWDSYWCGIESVIEEYMRERGGVKMLIYNIGFLNEENQQDETQLDLHESDSEEAATIELINLILSLKDEMGIKEVTHIDYVGYEKEDE